MSRAKFQIYRSRRSSLAETARDIMGQDPQLSKPLKKMTDDQVVSHMMCSSPQQVFGLDGLIISEELLWERRGRTVIFPQSAEFLDRLLAAKFDLNKIDGFQLPFDSFMLAMPLGYEREGVKLKGILVNAYAVSDTPALFREYAKNIRENLNPKLFPRLGINKIEYEHHLSFADNMDVTEYGVSSPDEKMLSICTMDQSQNIQMGSTIRAAQNFNMIPEMLSAKSVDEFEDRLGEMKMANYKVRGVSREDAISEFYAFKLVCALTVYNMATNGDMLKSGMPGEKAPHIEGRFDRKVVKPFHIQSTADMMSESKTPGMHYRQWHFRQLRDKRYYQGEHSKRVPGSRWVFVRDTMVGVGDTDPYTVDDAEQ